MIDSGGSAISGNVGIGTTNPNSQLDVVGAARICGGLDVGTDASGNANFTMEHVDSAFYTRPIDVLTLRKRSGLSRLAPPHGSASGSAPHVRGGECYVLH